MNARFAFGRAARVVARDVADAVLVDAIGDDADAIVGAGVDDLQIFEDVVPHSFGGSIDLHCGVVAAARVTDVDVAKPAEFVEAVAHVTGATGDVDAIQVAVLDQNVLNGN